MVGLAGLMSRYQIVVYFTPCCSLQLLSFDIVTVDVEENINCKI